MTERVTEESAVISEVELEPLMSVAIEETLNSNPRLISLFPNRGEGRKVTEEFLTSVLKITRFKHGELKFCEDHIDTAVKEEYSPKFAEAVSNYDNLQFINHILQGSRTNFSKVLNEAVSALKENLKTYYLDDFDDEDDVDGPLISVDELESNIWRYDFNEADKKIVIGFWSEIEKSDEVLIYDDETGYACALALCRYLCVPLSSRVESLGKELTEVLLELMRSS